MIPAPPAQEGLGAARRPGPGAPPRRRAWLRRGALLAVIAAALAIAGALIAPALIRAEVVRQAAARGIDLDPGAIQVEIGAVRLRGARFSLAGVRGLAGSAPRATVRLDGLSPARVEAEGISIALVGVGVAPELAAWMAAHGARAHELPLSVAGFRAGFHERAGGAELASLSAGSLEAMPAGAGAAGPGGALRDARVTVAGREIARTEAAWSIGAAGLSVGFGAASVAAAPLRVDLRPPPAPALTARFAPAPVAAIAAPLGLAAGLPGVTAGGSVELRLAGAAATPGGPAQATAVEATAALTLGGYVPPHPKELDGLLFGNATTVRLRARLAPDRASAALEEIEVVAGALRLRGTGALRLLGADAAIEADLSGSVPCSALAGSAVAAHLGAPLGRLAGDLARQALGGSVAVRIQVDARASRLDAARVDQSARVGCRLGR